MARRAGANRVVRVSWQQVCLGQAAAGHYIDVHVAGEVLQFWAAQSCSAPRPGTAPARAGKRRASIPGTRARSNTGSLKDQPE